MSDETIARRPTGGRERGAGRKTASGPAPRRALARAAEGAALHAAGGGLALASGHGRVFRHAAAGGAAG